MVGTAVVLEHPLALNSPTAIPDHSPNQEANCGGLLLIRQHLCVGQAGGIDGACIGSLVARTS
jgi:hypothetical protein